ncbi:MAG: ABC transporter substrate-binding protein [Candidatus Aquicultorales bacterium]
MAIGLATIILAVMLASGCSGGASDLFTGKSEEVDSIVMAYSPFESTALVWIAEKQGFFGRNGLKVIPRKYDSGAESLDGMLNGEADIAVGVAEFPL